VALDWLADATGFDFAAAGDGSRHEMGSRLKLAKGLRLAGRSQLPAHWKLIRSGIPHAEFHGAELDVLITEPGNYRAELWLDVAGEERIWILSNPIYVSAD